MIIQFGYITVFAAAMPLGAAFSLFFNIIEMYSDKYKLQKLLQRPFPYYAYSIGPWLYVINIMCLLSVYSNICIFAFSSNQIKKIFPGWILRQDDSEKHFIVIIFILEHVLLLIIFSMRNFIKDKMGWITVYEKRAQY